MQKGMVISHPFLDNYLEKVEPVSLWLPLFISRPGDIDEINLNFKCFNFFCQLG